MVTPVSTEDRRGCSREQKGLLKDGGGKRKGRVLFLMAGMAHAVPCHIISDCYALRVARIHTHLLPFFITMVGSAVMACVGSSADRQSKGRLRKCHQFNHKRSKQLTAACINLCLLSRCIRQDWNHSITVLSHKQKQSDVFRRHFSYLRNSHFITLCVPEQI